MATPRSRTVTLRQKRWSPRLRTAGALLGLLGLAGVLDEATSRAQRWPIAALLLLCGGILFALGQRWSERPP